MTDKAKWSEITEENQSTLTTVIGMLQHNRSRELGRVSEWKADRSDKNCRNKLKGRRHVKCEEFFSAYVHEMHISDHKSEFKYEHILYKRTFGYSIHFERESKKKNA